MVEPRQCAGGSAGCSPHRFCNRPGPGGAFAFPHNADAHRRSLRRPRTIDGQVSGNRKHAGTALAVADKCFRASDATASSAFRGGDRLLAAAPVRPARRLGSGVSTCAPWDRGWLAGHPTTPTQAPQAGQRILADRSQPARLPGRQAVCSCRAAWVLDVRHTWPSARDLAQSPFCCAGLAVGLAGPLSVWVTGICRADRAGFACSGRQDLPGSERPG